MAPKPKSERTQAETCTASRRNGEPCMAYPLKNRDKCRIHAGVSADGSSHSDNDNAVTHGAYTELSKLYNEVFSELEVDLCDRIKSDYITRYEGANGHSPTTGEEMRIFKMAVNAVTEMRVENWFTDKPESLDTGTPLVDRETHVSESGERFYRYKKSPAAAAVKHLEGYNRQWGKTMGLFDDPESKKAEGLESLSVLLSED